jgi:ankyrin repeat protein
VKDSKIAMVSVAKSVLALAPLMVVGLLAATPTRAAQDDDLFEASKKGDAFEVQLLLAAKANVNARLAGGWTPLMIAAWEGHLDVVQSLLAAKADVNAKTPIHGQTALIMASQQGHPTR